MAALSLLVVLVALPLLAAVVVTVVVLVVRSARRLPPDPSRAAAASRSHGATTNALAWLLAYLLWPVLMLPVGRLLVSTVGGGAAYNAVLAAAYPAVAGLVFLGVHALGERSWPRPSGPVRRATLEVRRARDGMPVWLHRLTWGWAGALVLALVGFGLTADGGRAVTHAVGSTSSTATPYPGWFYGVPLLVSVLVLLAASQGVLRLVAARPAVVDADPAYDAASRRLSAHRVLRGVQLLLGGVLAAVLGVGGSALGRVGLEGAGVGLTVLGVLVAVAAIGVAVVPARPAVQAADLGPQDAVAAVDQAA